MQAVRTREVSSKLSSLPVSIGLFGLVGFLLNFVWESWHAAYLYGFPVAGMVPNQFVRLISRVSFVDAAILTGIFCVGAVMWRSWQWYQHMSFRKYAYFIIVAVIWAAVIEYKGVYLLHQWEYSQLMPRLFGFGLSPLVQLAGTGLASLRLLALASIQQSRKVV